MVSHRVHKVEQECLHDQSVAGPACWHSCFVVLFSPPPPPPTKKKHREPVSYWRCVRWFSKSVRRNPTTPHSTWNAPLSSLHCQKLPQVMGTNTMAAPWRRRIICKAFSTAIAIAYSRLQQTRKTAHALDRTPGGRWTLGGLRGKL